MLCKGHHKWQAFWVTLFRFVIVNGSTTLEGPNESGASPANSWRSR